jgi:hypothetical protein
MCKQINIKSIKYKGLLIKAKLDIIYKETVAPNDPHKESAEDLYT